MGMLGKALTVGVGYVLAQPEVRQKLVALIRHPQVRQRREQVQDLATNGLRTAKHQLSRSSGTATSEAIQSAPTPPHPDVPTLSPSPRTSDHATFREGVLPPAEDSGVIGAREDS